MSPRITRLLTLIACAALISFPGLVRAQDNPLPNTLEKVKPSIVGVGTVLPTRQPSGKFVGTGFVVGDGNHAITNAHVIPKKIDTKNREILAILVDAGKSKTAVRTAKVVRIDEDHDLALIRFDGKPLPALTLGDSGRVREGELYAFTGFPIGMVLGFRPVTARGIVSAITPVAIPQLSSQQLDIKLVRRLHKPYDVFQLDAIAYPGNSGSPLFNPVTGQVIGVLNSVFVKESKENILNKPSAIAYAIPISYAGTLLRKGGQ